MDSDDHTDFAFDTAPVFAVSTGRCGSTLLSTMLRTHPDVLSLSEFFGLLLSGPFPAGVLSGEQYWALLSTPHPFVSAAYRIGNPVEEFLYVTGPGARFDADTGIPPIAVTTLPHLADSPDEMYDLVRAHVLSLTPAPIATQHRRLFGWLCITLGRSVWVERSGFSLRHVPELVELFPDARFVHLYRDGRECAYSMSRSGAFKMGAMWMQLQEALGYNPYLDQPTTSTPVRDNLRAFMPDTFDRAAFDAIELPAADFATIWSQQITAGLDALGAVDDRQVLHLSYEDLIADTARTLTDVGRFIGVAPEAPGWLRTSSAMVRPRPPRWLDLPAEDRERVEAACSDTMTRLYPSVAA
ncbi:MAG: sulfotransferase family protein [Jatrophihabitans sp.]